MGQQWVGGRATLSQEYPRPAPGALCPLIPHRLLFYFPCCLVTNVPPAKWSRCLGPFPYCPGLSCPYCPVSGCQACRLPRKSPLESSEPHGSP